MVIRTTGFIRADNRLAETVNSTPTWRYRRRPQSVRDPRGTEGEWENITASHRRIEYFEMYPDTVVGVDVMDITQIAAPPIGVNERLWVNPEDFLLLGVRWGALLYPTYISPVVYQSIGVPVDQLDDILNAPIFRNWVMENMNISVANSLQFRGLQDLGTDAVEEDYEKWL